MNQERLFSRTRIAPTPSGFLHLGNVLSFAVTAGLARKTKAKVLLRIDDLDRERVHKNYVQDIFDTLHYLEIPWDEGPRNYEEFQSTWSQLHRMDIYRTALQQLREQVFACNCSRTLVAKTSTDGGYPGTCRNKGLPPDTPHTAWRLRTEGEKELHVKTLSGTVINTVLPAAMKEFIVKRKDGFPAYQLASVVDDQYFGADLIVRGEDLWPSTLAQHYLAGSLPGNTFRENTFYHHPLLLEAGAQKMSKSAGSTSVQFLRKQGKKPGDIYALIAQMLGLPGTVTGFQALSDALVR